MCCLWSLSLSGLLTLPQPLVSRLIFPDDHFYFTARVVTDFSPNFLRYIKHQIPGHFFRLPQGEFKESDAAAELKEV